MPGESTEDDIPSHPHHEAMIAKKHFHVFLCYNTESQEDRGIVKEIGNELKKRGILPWLDIWEFRPGTPWQREIEQQIENENILAAAVFVGKEGVTSWLQMTTDALIREFVTQGRPVIPALLPGNSDWPKLPVLLKGMDRVDFRHFKQHFNFAPDEDPFNRLIFGITGRRPWEEENLQPLKAATQLVSNNAGQTTRDSISQVLVAFLGVSPMIVSAVYDHLTKRESRVIDRVVVLLPNGEDVARSYDLLRETLAKSCNLQSEALPFGDANSWINSSLFFRHLYSLLDTFQTRGNTVNLLLTGGPETLKALIASVASLFSCVKHLYHIVDPYNEYFLSIDELTFLPLLHKQLAMHPDLDRLIVMDIPIEPIPGKTVERKERYMTDENVKSDILPNLTLRRTSERKIANGQYDVFLCYKKEDKHLVEQIGNQLKEGGIAPWIDMWDIPPGRLWLREVNRQVAHIPAAAVIIGKAGVDSQQELQISAFLKQFIKRNSPVIPVLLEGASDVSDLPPLLEGMQPVDFRTDDDPVSRLIWGITGQRKEAQIAPTSHVLIASLGDSPVVVSSMYDLLTQQEGLAIDRVIVLHPKGEDVKRSYDLVKKALAGKCELWCEILPFDDANSWINGCLFLKELYTLLDMYEARGDTVYLSLAGGRKSMAALMAWVVPFFSCVKHLYHVIDPDEDHFLTINDLELDLTPSQRESAMHPDLTPLVLVDIPFESGQQINQEYILRLLSATEDEMERMQCEDAEKANFIQDIAQVGKTLEVLITEQVMEQFRVLSQQDRDAARRVRDCLERMQYASELSNYQQDTLPYKLPKSAKSSSTPVHLHFFKSFGAPVQPVFYTSPKDLQTVFDAEVERVVICELETGNDGIYRSLKEIVATPAFSTQQAYHLEKLPYVPPGGTTESVLIVALGKAPMVATQLYTLLTAQEGRNIREVILVFPAQATEIANGADIIKRALQEENNVLCKYATIKGLKDIDSPDACQSYQTVLEKVIDQVRETHSDYAIDLALSGGRKGMTAMTIFAAQNKDLPYVYHTLITDEQLSLDIDEQTTVAMLKKTGLSREERNDRLFLRAYDGNKPFTKFILFKVPVFPAG